MAPTEDNAEINDSGYSVAKDRSRRSKRGSKASARADLLAKIKNAKATGQKYVPEDEEEDIYDLVDEKEYTDIVRQRKDDKWIVDDGTGYVEDGRDLFDDEQDDYEGCTPKSKSKGSKKKNPNIRKPGSAPNISSMFAASAAKAKVKPKQDTSKHDDLLEELLASADSTETTAANTTSTAVKTGVKRKKPLPLFSRKPVVKPKVKEEPDSGHGTYSQASDHGLNGSQAISQMSGPLVVPESYEDVVIPSSQPIEGSVTSSHPITKSVAASAGELDMQVDEFDDDLDDDQLMEISDIKPEIKQEVDMSASWMVNGGDEKPATVVTAEACSTGALPTVTSAATQEQVFRFYWLDAYEDYFKHPGTIYLFGKTKHTSGAYVSCCVAVKNIYRQIFLLPRLNRYDSRSKVMTDESLTFLDVYNEFNNEVAPRFKIKNYKSRATGKQYSFDLSDVPTNAEYLEVRYGSEYPALPRDLSGETFSHVFGANKSSLELFLLEQKIRGPCWLDITTPQLSSQSFSWCKLDVLVTDFKTVSVVGDSERAPAPPLVTLTMCVKSAHNSKSNQNEVVQVACLVNSNYRVDKPAPDKLFEQHFLAVTKTSDLVFPLDLQDKAQTDGKHLKMEVLASERALLGFLLAKIHKYDPDILIGHDISNFELDFLLTRVAANKVPHWHKISRLKRSGDVPRKSMGKSSQIDRSAVCGRIVCDTMISARELIRAKSYDLTVLVQQLLHQSRVELDMEELKAAYSTTGDLLRVANLTIQDAFYAHKLMFELNILPLAWQITTICGNVLSRTLLGGRSERNEYLLLHAFTDKGYIVPDKTYASSKTKGKASGPTDHDLDEGEEATAPKPVKGRRKPAYAGGLVLEPKKGFYDTFILMLDFNSLYPSIIQEYNVCFTTVNRSLNVTAEEDEEFTIPDIPDSSLEPGILPVEIRKLVQSRRQVKALMKERGITKEQYMQYDIRQKALKLTANSMYGCLGFTYSRFFAKPLAALITAKGREILQKTKDLVEKMGLDVIYGDTDSIMINTNSRNFEDVYKLGNKVKAEVNKAYRLLEIDIDGVYKSMLLLKKKKYAALNVTKGADGQCITNQELKGLDIVRRDWCELSKQTGLYVVNEILSGESKETILENIHAKLREVKDAVHNGDIPLDLYHITKQLTKAPEAYPDKKSLPHVQVALRLNASAAKKLWAEDTVYYIICQDGTNLAPSQRAYHPDELSRNKQLKVDTEYYLAHQIHPVVSRLCDPIEGTDSALIAEMLGLDSSRYQHKVSVDDEEEETYARLVSDEEKYRLCSRLDIVCQYKDCGQKNFIDSPIRLEQGKAFTSSWAYCSSVSADGSKHLLHLSPATKDNVTDANINILKNKISLAIRSHVNKYYQGWLKCEDSACGHRTRRVPLQLYRGRPVCPACTKAALVQEYTESMLYDQLCFYKHIFDLSRRPKSDKHWSRDLDVERLHDKMTEFMNTKLESSAYGHIDLHKLFSKIVLPGTVLSTATRG